MVLFEDGNQNAINFTLRESVNDSLLRIDHFLVIFKKDDLIKPDSICRCPSVRPQFFRLVVTKLGMWVEVDE